MASRLALGITTFDTKKVKKLRKTMIKNAGIRALYILTPEALSATISYDSERFPNVIKLDSNTAKGKAIGIKSAREKNKSRATTCHSNPLPTRSSMYFQRNSIKNKNIEMKKVPRKGPIKAFTTRRLIFFMSTDGLLLNSKQCSKKTKRR